MELKVNKDRTVIAVKTNLPPPREYGYMSLDQGGGYVTAAEVSDWDDVDVPEPKESG